MLIPMLPLVSLVVGLARPVPGAPERRGDEVIASSPRAAQVQLAVVLGEAAAVYAVEPTDRALTFVIDREGQAQRVRASLDRRGTVIALAIAHAGPAIDDLGALSWLADELATTTAITRLVVDADGAATITTSDDRHYMAIPGRGSGGNAAVEARWAAAWNAPEA